MKVVPAGLRVNGPHSCGGPQEPPWSTPLLVQRFHNLWDRMKGTAPAAGRSLFFAAIAVLTIPIQRSGAEERLEIIENIDIFDNGASDEAEGVQIVNGRVVLTGDAKKPEKPAPPDPAGDSVLELTDGSQLHGKLTAFGKSDIVWQRADTSGPLTFSPQDVKRITFGGDAVAAQKANATVKLHGGDWLTGDLSGLQEGKFRLAIEGAGNFEIDRSKVEWLHLSKSAPPDAYEGPTGPMGLAGWDTGGPAGASAWDYADGALIARAAMPLTRRFEALSDRLDIEFSASDGGSAIHGLTLWLHPGLQAQGYSKGSIYLRFQANNISANAYDGSNMKNLSANMPEEKNAPKETRYRILQDRRSGKLIVFVNGKKVADWDTAPQAEPAKGGSLSWQPTYWSSNMVWTLSKVRVRPWDGSLDPDPKGEESTKDLLSNQRQAISAPPVTGWPIVNGERVEPGAKPKVIPARQAGTLDAITSDAVKFSGTEIPRKDPLFIRLNRAAAADPPAGSVARVWLSQRGEFDVTALGFRDGQLKVRTSFSGDITLPLTAVRVIEFPHRLAAAEKAIAEGGDTLIFRNGDELRGTLVGANHDQKVKWKPVKGTQPIEFTVNRLAGVLLAKSANPAPKTQTAAVRFRNGDWLPGELLHLDRQQIRLRSAIGDNLQLDRTGVRAIYFGQNSEVPVWDGASDPQSWMKTTNVEMSGGRRPGKDDNAKRNPWRYLDGAFNLPRNTSRNGYNNGPNIGRNFDTLPDKVEVSFEMSTPKAQAGYSIQLFHDENRQGLMIQGGWDSAYIYDMSPRKQGGVFFNQPTQIEFGETVGSEGNRRMFRFLADRRTGKLVMIVNGIPVGGFGLKSGTGKESPKPGKGIAIVPQPMNSSVTISNVWVGPWSGDAPEIPKGGRKNPRGGANAMPQGGIILNGGALRLGDAANGIVVNGKGKAVAPADGKKGEAADKTATDDGKKDTPEKKPATPDDIIALVNGDETSGTLESASATELHLQCDVGRLDIPLSRALVAEFAGPQQPPAAGVRLHLAGKGSVTVDSLQVADGRVTCHSAAAGNLTFSATALSEIVFQPRNASPPGNAADKKAGLNGGNLNGGIIINGAAGGIQIQGNVIINGGGAIFQGGAIELKAVPAPAAPVGPVPLQAPTPK